MGLIRLGIVGVAVCVVAEFYHRNRRKLKNHQLELVAQEAQRESEQQFQTLANRIPQLCWMTDANGWIFWYNQRWFDYTGTTLEEMQGWGWQKVHHPDHVQRVVEKISRCFATGEDWEDTFPLRGRDGKYRWFLSRGICIRDKNGEIVRWFGTNTDVSELRETQDAEVREREERFRALVTATSDVVCSLTPDWSEMRELHGKTFLADTNTPNRTWLQKYVHPDDQSHVMEVINAAIRTKSIFELEHRVFRADGSVGWTLSRAVPLLDDNGEIVEWFGTASDITERKKAEEVWRHLSAIVESSHDAIIGRTIDGTITCWNPAAERLYGYSAAEIVGQSVTEFIPDYSLNDESNVMRRVADGEYIEDYEAVRRRKDGSLVDVSLRLSPILDASGCVVGVSSIARDISERKIMQEALLRSEKLAVTGRLAATIAHEINNPLAAAMNAVYLARTSPTQADEMLQLAQRELQRAAHITKQTLGFYRDSGNSQQVTSHDVVKEVLSVYATKLRNRNITVHYRHRCSSDSPREGCPDECKQCQKYLCVNAGELRQVISNLLANGIDAISDGGTMHIRTSRSSGKVRLTMADNGYGIRTENLKRIFEPFFTTKKDFGTGLGLWVTQELVRKHNGAMKVRGSEGKGTVFRMTFPQERTEGGVLLTVPSTPSTRAA